MRRLKNRSLLIVNDCFEGEHNAAIGVFLQALLNKLREVKKTWFLKNMVSHCCIILLQEKIENMGLKVADIKLGEVTVHLHNEKDGERLEKLIAALGFVIIKSRDVQVVEQIKIAVIELIHQLNNMNSIIRKSDYLMDKLGMSYQQISKIFSQHESITLEKYIILQKVEKIKELIDSDEYSLSEIAYMMDYSSVQHLSSQFKNTSGLTPSEYRKSDRTMRKSLDQLY